MRTDVEDSLRRLRNAIGGLPAADFLQAKANNIQQLAKATLG